MNPEDIYEHPEPGEWILPVMNGYKMRCCDCKLVHTIDFEAGRMASDGGFVPDPRLRVMIRVERDEVETERSRQLDKAKSKATKTTPVPTIKKPRQTPPKATKGTKPAPEGTGTRQRAGKATQGARKPRQKPTGSHLSTADRNFCWASVPENDEAGEE